MKEKINYEEQNFTKLLGGDIGKCISDLGRGRIYLTRHTMH